MRSCFLCYLALVEQLIQNYTHEWWSRTYWYIPSHVISSCLSLTQEISVLFHTGMRCPVQNQKVNSSEMGLVLGCCYPELAPTNNLFFCFKTSYHTTGRQMDGWMDGWMDGHSKRSIHLNYIYPL